MRGDLLKKTLLWSLFLLLGGIGAPVILAAAATYFIARPVFNAIIPSSDEQSMPAPGQQEKATKRIRTRDEAVRRGRWETAGLPIGMEITSVPRRGEVTLKAAGIDGLVKGYANGFIGNRARYNFSVKDVDMALKLQEYVQSSGIYATVKRNGNEFLVESSSLSTINYLANTAFPKKEIPFKRDVVHGNQYVVSGAASYDDAVRMFKEDRACGKLMNTYVSVTDTFNGIKGKPEVSGDKDWAKGVDTLPLGSYIITEEEIHQSAGKISVPGDRVTPEQVSAYASDVYEAGKHGEEIVSNVSLVDSTSEKVKRTIHTGPFEQMEIVPSDRIADKTAGLKAYFVLDSEKDLKVLAGIDSLPANTFMVVSSNPPEVSEDKFLVALSLSDERVRSLVECQGNLPVSTQLEASKYGVSAEQLNFSRMVHQTGPDGYTNVVLKGDLPADVLYDSATVNGVSLSDIGERLMVDRMPSLNRERMKQWSRDAAEIRSVNITVDPMNETLKVDYMTGDSGVVRSVEKKVSQKDIEALSARGAISSAEKKDLLMQLVPEKFVTYSDGRGNGLYKNPVEAFCNNRKPQTVTQYNAAVARKQKEGRTMKPGKKI